ncbi:hypothetical protein PCANC_11462 [Puccinia coronata f. sp. avenae]|uniref:Uncharacterized protein n=1 Tax=Puccinia coronata f. sp. avenae TaxID=200324 RepID=A0A2N5VCM2_9BASI|nr:hypothetical protein PCANC_11462 [Puccinia coronata f. sp. avenae]
MSLFSPPITVNCVVRVVVTSTGGRRAGRSPRVLVLQGFSETGSLRLKTLNSILGVWTTFKGVCIYFALTGTENSGLIHGAEGAELPACDGLEHFLIVITYDEEDASLVLATRPDHCPAIDPLTPPAHLPASYCGGSSQSVLANLAPPILLHHHHTSYFPEDDSINFWLQYGLRQNYRVA